MQPDNKMIFINPDVKNTFLYFKTLINKKFENYLYLMINAKFLIFCFYYFAQRNFFALSLPSLAAYSKHSLALDRSFSKLKIKVLFYCHLQLLFRTTLLLLKNLELHLNHKGTNSQDCPMNLYYLAEWLFHSVL